MYDRYEHIMNGIYAIFIIYIICASIAPIIYLIMNFRLLVKQLFGKISYHLSTLIRPTISNNQNINDFYKAVMTYDDELIFDHIADVHNFDSKSYFDLINEKLYDKKQYIIDSIIKFIVNDSSNINLKISLRTFHTEFIRPFVFCCGLDHDYTGQIIQREYKKNPNNTILNLQSLFFEPEFEGEIMKKYNIDKVLEKNKQLEEENNYMRDHIRYMPDGEMFFELMESFNQKAKQQ
jgi:hypothetical protein